MPNAIMRLLTILGVLLCSMHVAEPAYAHSSANEAAFHLSVSDSEQDRQEPAPKLAHGGHHHCPVAPDLRPTLTGTAPLLSRALLFAQPAAQFVSRTLPPLLDPPLAI